jgi:hypothetical protein
MPNLWSWAKFIRMLVYTRWPRYLVAGLALLLGVAFIVITIAGAVTWLRDVKHTTGTLASVAHINDSETGAYKYAALVLTSSSQTYQLDAAVLSPALAESNLRPGAAVELWYIEPPFSDPQVVAIQLAPSAEGAPIKYTTELYIHPGRLQTSALLFGGLLLVIGALVAVAGQFLPAPESDSRRQEKREQAKPRSYGQMVVGTPPSQRTPVS